MELLASLLGGLGLFLVGIKTLGTNLQLLAGPRLRAGLALATRDRLATAGTGLALGMLTQSSNAVTYIAASLATAGLLSLPAGIALLAWANPGTAGLVLLATVDLRLAVLWLVGLVGFLSAFGVDRGGRLKPALGALMGLGLLFLGLDLVKQATAPLLLSETLRDLLAQGHGSVLLPFLLGGVATLLVQSSSTIGILALTLHGVGLLDFPQTVAAVLGASLGSGLAVLLPMRGLAGTARRLVLFQAASRALATLGFTALFIVEWLTGLPLLGAAIQGAVAAPGAQIGLLFLLLQLAPALLLAPFAQRIAGWMVRLSPETPAEALGRPRYLFDKALEDAATALELAAKEQALLLARLPLLLDAPRGEASPGQPPRATLLAATAAVEQATRNFLSELLARGGAREAMAQAVALQDTLGTLTALRETLAEFGDAIEESARHPALAPLLLRLAEALHLLLLQLGELPEADAEDAALLLTLASDRSEMMEGLRRRMAAEEPDLPPGAQQLLFRGTAQFERAVWLTRRLALALRPA